MKYSEQLLSPLWQRKRLDILSRDKFTCQICSDTETQLHIHHKEYDKSFKTLAWEYPDNVYVTLCSVCHKAISTHIKKYGNDKEFDVLKVKLSTGEILPFVYSYGTLLFPSKGINVIIITELETKQIVQFLINNWLKNG